MDKLPFVVAENVEGEERIPKRVSKLLLAPKNVGTRNVSMGLNVTAVAVMLLIPAQEAPMMEAMLPISSSIWTNTPSVSGSLIDMCTMISDAGVMG